MTTTLLINIQLQIGRIGDPICIFVGNISGAIGLFVFLQKTNEKKSMWIVPYYLYDNKYALY